MEKINPYAFYRLGMELHPLTTVSANDNKVAIKEIFWPLWQGDQAMGLLLAGYPIRLGFSKSAAQALKNTIHTLFTEHFGEEKGGFKFPSEGENPTIGSWVWGQVTGALNTFQTVFQTEMENATTYQVSKKGLYSTVDLVEAAEEAFSGEIAPYVSQKTKSDFHAAGRCLAFNLPTAAGFHAARATEGMLELYWQTFTGKTGTRNGWQAYIDDLQAVIDSGKTPTPTKRVLDNIRVAKDYDRNPVVHPRDVVLSEVDARILFSACESLILSMAQEVKEAQAAGGAQLALVGPA